MVCSPIVIARVYFHSQNFSWHKMSNILNGGEEILNCAVNENRINPDFNDRTFTKSSEICLFSERRGFLPSERNHIHENSSKICKLNVKSVSHLRHTNACDVEEQLTIQNNRLKQIIHSQLDLIEQLRNESVKQKVENKKNILCCRKIKFIQEFYERSMADLHYFLSSTTDSTFADFTLASLKVRIKQNESRMCLECRRGYEEPETGNILSVEGQTELRTMTPVSTEHNNINKSSLPTKYCGRNSSRVPLRALKRRILTPRKELKLKDEEIKKDCQTSNITTEPTHSPCFSHSSRLSQFSPTLPSTRLSQSFMSPQPAASPQSSAATQPSTSQVITESSELSQPLNQAEQSQDKLVNPPNIQRVLSKKNGFLMTDKAYFLPDNWIEPDTFSSPSQIDVPSYKLKTYSSFYQMEGTENLNDPVFEKRHKKCEQDERRRKRRDIQMLKEQKAKEKLKLKQSKEGENHAQQKPLSFYPKARHIEYIEVTEQLPVLAFGHLIPYFQPCEFSLTWLCDETAASLDPVLVSKAKKSRLSTAGSRVT